jgi:hypothetical protein
MQLFRSDCYPLAESARKYQFTLLAELFECLDSANFVASCFGANLNQSRMRQYLSSANLFLRQDRTQLSRSLRMRNFVIQEDFQAAFTLLIAPHPDSPFFSLDVMKAALVNNKEVSAQMAASIAGLISGGMVDDAIDILILTHQFRQAAQLMLAEGNAEIPIHMMRAVPEESDDSPLLDQVISFLLSARNWKMAVQVLIGFGEFTRAAKILKQEGFGFPSAVIGAMRQSEGQFVLEWP